MVDGFRIDAARARRDAAPQHARQSGTDVALSRTDSHRWSSPQRSREYRHVVLGNSVSHELPVDATDSNAHVTLTVYFSDPGPAGPYKVEVPALRTRHVRFNGQWCIIPNSLEPDEGASAQGMVTCAQTHVPNMFPTIAETRATCPWEDREPIHRPVAWPRREQSRTFPELCPPDSVARRQ